MRGLTAIGAFIYFAHIQKRYLPCISLMVAEVRARPLSSARRHLRSSAARPPTHTPHVDHHAAAGGLARRC